mmetsp:Transcript_62410/g.115861  ORF Transcript_62410/g.115861 Transcript_62410/m.115861 type:complete len:208 (+) Transcript_62410:700-1323(+)
MRGCLSSLTMLTSFSKASFSLICSPTFLQDASTGISLTATIRPVSCSNALNTLPSDPSPSTSPRTHERHSPWTALGASSHPTMVLLKEVAVSAAKDIPVTVPSKLMLHWSADLLRAAEGLLGELSAEKGSGPSATKSQLLSIRILKPLPTSKLVQLLLARLNPRGPKPCMGGGAQASSASAPSISTISILQGNLPIHRHPSLLLLLP